MTGHKASAVYAGFGEVGVQSADDDSLSYLSCSICSELHGVRSNVNKEYDELIDHGRNILWSDGTMALLPSLGPLNSTHCLIVPYRHVNSFSCLNEEEIASFRAVVSRLRGRYGSKLIMFEHGTGVEGSSGGASVTHAHTHAIAVENDSALRHERMMRAYREISNEDLFYHYGKSKAGYLFFEDCDGHCYISFDDKVESQYYRKMIASELGVANWNWRFAPKMSEVLKVKGFQND